MIPTSNKLWYFTFDPQERPIEPIDHDSCEPWLDTYGHGTSSVWSREREESEQSPEEFVAEAEHSTLGLGFRCSTITHAGCGSFRQGRRACKPARAWHGDLITVLTRCRLMGEHRQDFHLVQNTGLSIEFDFQLEQPVVFFF